MLDNKNRIHQIVCFVKTQQRLLFITPHAFSHSVYKFIYPDWLHWFFPSYQQTYFEAISLPCLIHSDIKLKQGRMCQGMEKKMAFRLIKVTRTKLKVNLAEENKTFWNIFSVLWYLVLPPPPPTCWWLATEAEKTLANSWISLWMPALSVPHCDAGAMSNRIFLLPWPLSTHRDCASPDSMVLSCPILFIVEPYSVWNYNFNLFPFKSGQ